MQRSRRDDPHLAFPPGQGAETSEKITDTTNELLTKNSEMLKQGALEIARQSERGIVDLETLRKVNAALISTLEETIHIQEEGRNSRRNAEVELKKMEEELKQKLVAIKKA